MLKYSYMIQDIHAVRDKYESAAFRKQPSLEKEALALWNSGKRQEARELLTQYSQDNAQALLKDWWKLSEDLYLKYNDGYINDQKSLAQPVFYPSWWLQKVGYENGPTSYEKPAAETKN